MGMFDRTNNADWSQFGGGGFRKRLGGIGGGGGQDKGAEAQTQANTWLQGQQGLIAPQMQGQMPVGQQAPQFQPQFQQGGDFRSVGMQPMQQASQAYQNQAVNMESPLARIMRMYGGEQQAPQQVAAPQASVQERYADPITQRPKTNIKQIY